MEKIWFDGKGRKRVTRVIEHAQSFEIELDHWKEDYVKANNRISKLEAEIARLRLELTRKEKT